MQPTGNIFNNGNFPGITISYGRALQLPIVEAFRVFPAFC
jgi:hypothetical protein